MWLKAKGNMEVSKLFDENCQKLGLAQVGSYCN